MSHRSYKSDDDEDEEGDVGGQGPSAYPLPGNSTALGSRAVVPSPPAAVDGDDSVAMDVEMGTIKRVQALR